MKTRYKNGKAVANVYFPNEHCIEKKKIDSDALKVISKLNDYGYEAYLVGGAVRDLILGKNPKDFDVTTNASPRQIHKIFYNSRVIGRRFRLVHVFYGEKIIEVSTFRSNEEHDEKNDNNFGSLEEDASRRDFSINSLYYNPIDETVLDFNNAFEDFRDKKITAVIPLSKSFTEDPVRMIRAVKYSVTTGFDLRFNIKRAIKRNSPELGRVSTSRMTEELNKILNSGYSSRIFRELKKYRLFVYMLPCISIYSKHNEIYSELSKIDSRIQKIKKGDSKAGEVEQHELYLALTSPFITRSYDANTPSEIYKDVFRQIKFLISPNTPPNYVIENASKVYLKENGFELPKPSARKKQTKKTISKY